MEDDRNGERAGNIALIGFMGAGKSVVGELLAAKLGMDFVDLDETISARAGMSVEEIFAREGVDGFRERESAALREETEADGLVIACGGGAVLRAGNVELLQRTSRVYLLEISKMEAVERLEGSVGRPLLAEDGLEDRVGRLMEERAARYRNAAHEVVEADDSEPEEIAEEIAARWRRYRS